MDDEMASTQSEVKALLDNQFEAMRTKDIDQLMSLYSADIGSSWMILQAIPSSCSSPASRKPDS